MTPSFGENARKLGIRSLGLYLRPLCDVRRGRIAKLLENIDRKRAVAKLRKLARLDFDVLAEPTFWMDKKQRRPRFLSLGISHKPRYPVVFRAIGSLDDFHRSFSSRRSLVIPTLTRS